MTMAPSGSFEDELKIVVVVEMLCVEVVVEGERKPSTCFQNKIIPILLEVGNCSKLAMEQHI